MPREIRRDCKYFTDKQHKSCLKYDVRCGFPSIEEKEGCDGSSMVSFVDVTPHPDFLLAMAIVADLTAREISLTRDIPEESSAFHRETEEVPMIEAVRYIMGVIRANGYGKEE